MRIAAVSMALLALSACASGPPRMPVERIDRALKGAPGEAQPGQIVAVETAFAQAARDDGQWTAFRRFAGPNAIIHGRNGPIVAEPWLAAQQNPAEAVRWAPRTVWMSCDGSLAVSQGRFVDPAGLVGSFVTVWQRERDREYRWIYDMGAPDNPQPPPPEPDQPRGEYDIIVTGIDAIEGKVADCPRAGALVPQPPGPPPSDQTAREISQSADGTLRWRWEHRADGTRAVSAMWLRDGQWQEAMEFVAPPQASE